MSAISVSPQTDVTLHGWLIRKDLAGLPTIFYFGGDGEEVSHNIEAFERHLPANAVLFNYRGYGMSTGRPSESALKGDAVFLVKRLAERFAIDQSKIIVVGRSLGSGIAVHVSVHFGIQKTILVTPYESIRNVAYDHFPKFIVNLLLRERYETEVQAGKLKHRVLLLVAADDRVIPPYHADALYDLIPGDKLLIRFEGWGHNTIGQDVTYWESLVEFIGS